MSEIYILTEVSEVLARHKIPKLLAEYIALTLLGEDIRLREQNGPPLDDAYLKRLEAAGIKHKYPGRPNQEDVDGWSGFFDRLLSHLPEEYTCEGQGFKTKIGDFFTDEEVYWLLHGRKPESSKDLRYLYNNKDRLDILNFGINVLPYNRMEHCHVLGATGAGKSMLLQQLLWFDRKENPEATVIVIDSQGDLIQTILAAEFVSNEDVVLIDPNDMQYPIALNIFDVGQGKRRNEVDEQKHINGVIELLTFVFASVLGAELTQKQDVALKFVLRLLLHIPNATIHTLRDILQPGGIEPYRSYVSKLTESGQQFFKNEFDSKAFQETKTQVLRRLYGLLENPVIERLFSNPRSKFDMSKEMDGGKLILINTAKDLLKGQASSFFGRFFISLITLAAQDRAGQRFRRPTFVYIDEAHEYIDENISTLLEQARKYNVSVTLAHQTMAQLPHEVSASVRTNTSTKFVSGVSSEDAHILAADMRCDPEFLMNQPKLRFAMYSKGLTKRAIQVEIVPKLLDQLPRRPEVMHLVAENRAKYAVEQAPQAEKTADPPTSHVDDIESLNKSQLP